jgi:hypothetical protein
VSGHARQLRRRLATRGGFAANDAAIANRGRVDLPEYRAATLVETPLRHIDVRPAVAWTDNVAFLDGTQHVELVGYAGTQPLLAATIRAAVRLRSSRRLSTSVAFERRLIIGREPALDALGDLPDGCEAIAIDADEPPHPVADIDHARSTVDRLRSQLEIEAARAFRVRPGCGSTWLVADGTLGLSPEWTRDARMVGVVKSHAMLPFSGDELLSYLTLPVGHRSSIFVPQTRRVTPLYAWALRLHPFAGRDLFHGLIRIEAPATEATREWVNTISAHLLAERAPLSNDPRADRLLYGVHDVERFLGAQAG